MQNAKDTFLMTLRDRLVSLNPGRTVVVRGAVRPAVLAAENELEFGEGDPLDAFVLRWCVCAVDRTEPMPLESCECEISYATNGTALFAGVDRGRVLAAMDAELRQMLMPAVAVKKDYTGDAAMVKQTNLFWSESKFGTAELKAHGVSRVVTVRVFALSEAGEA